MYVPSLGATPRCLSLEQSAEAVRLCNCKLYGTPSGPVSGFGAARADHTSDAYTSGGINLDTEVSRACDPRPKLRMPADFDPDDPCEGTSRRICASTLSRPGQQTTSTPAPPRDDFDFDAAEEAEVDKVLTQQRFVVFGILGAVLVGGGYLVYRVTRKN